jgi:hypothetical protein
VWGRPASERSRSLRQRRTLAREKLAGERERYSEILVEIERLRHKVETEKQNRNRKVSLLTPEVCAQEAAEIGPQPLEVLPLRQLERSGEHLSVYLVLFLLTF